MIECWLSFNNREQVLQLPITPTFTLSVGMNNQIVNIHALGDLNLPGNPQLKELTIESFFPAAGHNYYFPTYSPTPDPWAAVKTIDGWRKNRKPIRIIFTDTPINEAMLIERFDYGVTDGTKDVSFVLELKEYKSVKAPRLATADATTVETTFAGKHEGKKEWTVSYGDTLTGIALSVFGDSKKYKKILELNKDKIKNPDSLKALAGEVLRLE